MVEDVFRLISLGENQDENQSLKMKEAGLINASKAEKETLREPVTYFTKYSKPILGIVLNSSDL